MSSQKIRLLTATLFSMSSTILGVVPFILVSTLITDLLNPLVDQAVIWNLIFLGAASILPRYALMIVSLVISHVAAYNIL
jgi:ATP-binding cassette, subfamily B, bacterial IrtA/YbtP